MRDYSELKKQIAGVQRYHYERNGDINNPQLATQVKNDNHVLDVLDEILSAASKGIPLDRALERSINVYTNRVYNIYDLHDKILREGRDDRGKE